MSAILCLPIVRVVHQPDAASYTLTYRLRGEEKTLTVEKGRVPWSRIRQVSPLVVFPKLLVTTQEDGSFSEHDITELYLHFSKGEILEHVTVPIVGAGKTDSGEAMVQFVPPNQPLSTFLLPNDRSSPEHRALVTYDAALPMEIDLEIVPANPLAFGEADYRVLAARLHS